MIVVRTKTKSGKMGTRDHYLRQTGSTTCGLNPNHKGLDGLPYTHLVYRPYSWAEAGERCKRCDNLEALYAANHDEWANKYGNVTTGAIIHAGMERSRNQGIPYEAAVRQVEKECIEAHAANLRARKDADRTGDALALFL